MPPSLSPTSLVAYRMKLASSAYLALLQHLPAPSSSSFALAGPYSHNVQTSSSSLHNTSRPLTDVLLQIIILILGFYQVYEGLDIWGKPSPLPHGTIIAWGVLLAFWVVVYLAGFALFPRQWMERLEAQRLVSMGRMGRGEKVGAAVDGEGRRESVVPLQDEARRAEVA